MARELSLVGTTLSAAASGDVRLLAGAWRPQESPAWPALVEAASRAPVRLALLNARMTTPVFLTWFQRPLSRALLGRIVSRFTLIVPQSDIVRRLG